MFMKKLLATVASIALTGGALLGVSAPAFADEVEPAVVVETTAPNSQTGESESDPSGVTKDAPAPDPAPAAPAPAAAKSVASVQTQATTQSRVQTQAKPDPGNQDGDEKKAWVCKFVSSENSPSGFRLKEGKQPIHVSVNALGDDVNDTGTFNDKQPSFVVDSDDASLCSYSEVSVDEEIVCPTYQYSGVVNITTTTRLFYGATQVGFTIEHTTRALTEGEARDCDPQVEQVYVCQFEASNSHPSGWVLKSGDQPVLMLVSELGEDVNDSGNFDATTPSFIVASDDSALCASKKVERSTEFTCATAEDDGFATVTIVRSFYYGSVKVKETTVEKVRALSEQEIYECGPVEVVRATAEVSFLDATCNAPQQLILGPITNATWGEITDPEGPQDYSVTATASAGAEFVSGGPDQQVAAGTTTLTFAGTFAPQLDPSDPECDLVTLGLVMPAVTFVQTSCSVAGSYRLGVAEGYDPSLVTFTVNGVTGIVAGTYTVAGPGLVEVTAQVVDPNGLEFDWVDPPAFSFVVPSDSECGEVDDTQLETLALPTLAFTGGGGNGPLWWLASRA
ncbi:hypothetical protein A20C1_05756 [marine actinobacterium PHSC20C1]|nr:hypothetical protein A20C1_05756 [marine actinobacterium PHSC20C1]